MNIHSLIARSLLRSRLALVGLADTRLRKRIIALLRKILRNRNRMDYDTWIKAQLTILRTEIYADIELAINQCVELISAEYEMPEGYEYPMPDIKPLIRKYVGWLWTEYQVWMKVGDMLGKSETQIIQAATTYLGKPYGNPLYLEAKRKREPQHGDSRRLQRRKVSQGQYISSYNSLRRLMANTIATAFTAIELAAWEKSNAIAYWVVRGSTYPCKICSTKIGYHAISDTANLPPYHPFCECIAYPVYATEQ